MRNSIIALSLTAALVTVPTTAFAQDAKVFNAAGAWSLDYGDDYCRLAGAFSDGEDQISLALERSHPSNQARLVLVGDAIRPYRAADTITYNYLPSGAGIPAAYFKSAIGDGQQLLNFGNINFAAPFDFGAFAAEGAAPPPPPAEGADFEPIVIPPYDRAAEKTFAAGVTGIYLDAGLTSPIRINTGKMSGPIEALQGCADDLIASWGLDAEKHQTMTATAAPAEDARYWVPNGTIGFGDFESLSGGRNSVRVMIDATGKPTDCQVHWPSLKDSTNKNICKSLIENGKFTPAKDANGQAMASYWTVEPFFLLPPFG